MQLFFLEHCPFRSEFCFCGDAEKSAASGFIWKTLSTCIMTVGSRWECQRCSFVLAFFSLQSSKWHIELWDENDISRKNIHLWQQNQIKILILLQKQKGFVC